MKDMKVRLTFTDSLLGTASADPEIHSKFIASKAPDAPSREEEIAALGVDTVEKKAMTVFPKMEDGTPHLWSYQVRGFFKHACAMNKERGKDTLSSKIKAHKKYIDGLVFVYPRAIPINFDGEITSCQRPLRGSTAQGERISLANSEMIPEGATIEFTVRVLRDDLMDVVREWLDYGYYNGIGQWRNAGHGTFTWEEIE